MAERYSSPLCGHALGPNWIDTGTLCVSRSTPPACIGVYQDASPALALARGYVFIIFEQLPQVGAGKIIRKVAVVPRDFSLQSKTPGGSISLAEHVLNLHPQDSQFLSASGRPIGAPSISGEPLLLDTAKITKAGGRVYSTAEVVADLKAFSSQHPNAAAQITKLIEAIESVEGEMLVEGGVPAGAASRAGSAHKAFIQSAEELWQQFTANKISRDQLQEALASLEKSYRRTRVVGRVGRVVSVFGVVLTTLDLSLATKRSINERSFKPIGAETVRQVGGWGGALAGAKIGGSVGIAVGIETGPGAFITGAVGALIFGGLGYFGADWVADQISPN